MNNKNDGEATALSYADDFVARNNSAGRLQIIKKVLESDRLAGSTPERICEILTIFNEFYESGTATPPAQKGGSKKEDWIHS